MSYHIQSEATTTTQLFVDELKDWLRDKLITKVLAKIVKLFVPGGNALVIIDTIYTAFTTIRDYAAQFQSLFNTLSQSVAALANGDRSQAVSQLKAVLHNATAIAIGFLAKFAGFNKIGQQVKAAIHKAEKQLKEVFEKIKKKVLVKVEAFIGGKGKDKKKGDGKDDDGKKKEGEEEKNTNQPLSLSLLRDGFTADNKVNHTIYFDKKPNGTFVLTIHSTKRTYKDFINGLKIPDGDQQKANAKRNLMNWVVQMDQLVLAKHREKDAEKLKKIDQDIRTLFNNICSETIILFRVGGSSVPKFGPKTSAGFGTYMEIDYLTKESYPGGKGTDTGKLYTPVYKKLDQRKALSKPYYVRGHLLSEKLNGPGIWDNMSPLNHSANGLHESYVEKHLKKGTQEKGNAYYYSVKVIYGRKINTSLLEELDKDLGRADEEKEVLKNIIESEQYVPIKFLAKAEEWDPETGKIKIAGESYNEEIKNEIEESTILNYKIKTSPVPKTLLINAQTNIDHLKFYFKNPGSKIPESIINFFKNRYFRQDYWDKKTNKEKCKYLADSIKSLKEDRLKELLVQGKIKF